MSFIRIKVRGSDTGTFVCYRGMILRCTRMPPSDFPPGVLVLSNGPLWQRLTAKVRRSEGSWRFRWQVNVSRCKQLLASVSSC